MMYLVGALASVLLGRRHLGHHIQSVNDTGDPTQDGQTDVDQEVGTAATLKEDTKRREDEGEEDLADIAVLLEKC